MEDFASAAMMRLVAAGMARQGLSIAAPAPARGPHVALASKRNALGDILDLHGPLALLRIGEAMGDVKGEPVMAAMEAARTPHDVFDRWRRLESYAHAKHRTLAEVAESQRLVVHHYSKDGKEAPRPEEDLLIFGVLIGLIRWVGATDVKARPAGDREWSFDGAWSAPAAESNVATWEIVWTGVHPRPTPLTGGDEKPVLPDLLSSDLTRSWTIEQAARELAMSKRSLQRTLSQDGKTYSQVLAHARASEAVRLLSESELGLAEIGFLCGYADQAHFTRSFRGATAATPHEFRKRLRGSGA